MMGTNTITLNPEELNRVLESGLNNRMFKRPLPNEGTATWGFNRFNYVKKVIFHRSGKLSVVIGDESEDREAESSGTEEQAS